MYYESLLDEAAHHDVEVQERIMQSRIKGLYGPGVIWINKAIGTTAEKACVLAEEIGHHHTTYGDILDQSKIVNLKQERLARKWAWERLVSPEDLVDAYHAGCQTRFEVADFLQVTEDFLGDTLAHLKAKHGEMIKVDDRHILYLEPLAVLEKF